MLSSNKLITLNGQSSIEVDGAKTQVMTLVANLNERNNITINLTALDADLYITNKDAVNVDIMAFITEMIQKVGSNTTSTAGSEVK